MHGPSCTVINDDLD